MHSNDYEHYSDSLEISLNLTNISPTMEKFPKFTPITIQELRIQYNHNSEKLHNGQPLKEIEEQLSEFEDQQQYPKLKVHTITGSSFFLKILIILIVIYCNRRILIKVCQNSKIISTRQVST